MKTKLLAAIGLALFALAGLSLSEETKQQSAPISPTPAAVQTAKPEISDQFIVIGYLEKRDRVITIKSGPKGRVYSVATKDGKVLHENLSSEQLNAQAPELHDLIKTGVAGDASVRASKLDARF